MYRKAIQCIPGYAGWKNENEEIKKGGVGMKMTTALFLGLLALLSCTPQVKPVNSKNQFTLKTENQTKKIYFGSGIEQIAAITGGKIENKKLSGEKTLSVSSTYKGKSYVVNFIFYQDKMYEVRLEKKDKPEIILSLSQSWENEFKRMYGPESSPKVSELILYPDTNSTEISYLYTENGKVWKGKQGMMYIIAIGKNIQDSLDTLIVSYKDEGLMPEIKPVEYNVIIQKK